MIIINDRISEINLEIGKLTGELNRYDSQIDYSTINLTIYGEPQPEDEKKFGGELLDSFLGGIDAFISLVKLLLNILATVLPFMVVPGIAVGTYFFVKKRKKKKL